MRKIQILGTGCPKCQKLYELAKQACDELGIEYEIEKVEDINKIISMGVMMTPALAVNGKVKVSGKVLSVESLKQVIMDSENI